MAKKTSTRAKAEPSPETPAEVSAPKTRVRAKSTKALADKAVASDRAESTLVSVATEPTEESIRIRAYHRYLERGGGHGMDFEDWLEARRELRESTSRR